MVSLGKRLVMDALKSSQWIVKWTPHSGKTLTSQLYRSKKEAEAFASAKRRAKDSYDVKLIPVQETDEGWRYMNDDF